MTALAAVQVQAASLGFHTLKEIQVLVSFKILAAVVAVGVLVYFAFIRKSPSPPSNPVTPDPKPPQNLP